MNYLISHSENSFSARQKMLSTKTSWSSIAECEWFKYKATLNEFYEDITNSDM